MHGKSWIILRLFLHKLEVIISERSLRTSCSLIPVVTIWIEYVLGWVLDARVFVGVLGGFPRTVIVELLLCSSSRILPVRVPEHGLDRDLSLTAVSAMDGNRLELEVVARGSIETHI